jgi:hypothetical protein
MERSTDKSKISMTAKARDRDIRCTAGAGCWSR